jgi:hypothetical protein
MLRVCNRTTVKSFASLKGVQRERCGAERTAAKHNDRGAVTLLK